MDVLMVDRHPLISKAYLEPMVVGGGGQNKLRLGANMVTSPL